MTSALETYLHQIGLVPEMLIPISQRSDDAAAREDPASFGQQQQQQQSTAISLAKDESHPLVARFISSTDGKLIHTNPIIEASSAPGSSYQGPAAVAVANYSSSGEPTYVHSTWNPAADASSRAFLMGDAIINRHPNAVTTVTVSNNPNDTWTKSSHENPNITQVSHVTQTLSSSPSTRQTVQRCPTEFNPFSHNNVTQVTSLTSGYQTTANPMTQSVPVDSDPVATVRAADTSNSLSGITKHIHVNDRTCLVDIFNAGRLSSPGVSGSNLSTRDNSHVISSIRQNPSDFLHLDQTPFNQSHALGNHCSPAGILPNRNYLPTDDSKTEEAEVDEVILSPWTLSTADSSSPPLSQSSNDTFQNQSTIIKSSLKKDDVSPKGVRKAVTFCTSDLVHVEEYTISPATPPHDLFLPFDRQLENISEDTNSVVFGRESAELWSPGTQENRQGSWFNASTDTESYLMDFLSPSDETKDCAPLAFANDVFGRTTIFLTCGTFRPGESGKLNGKTVSDLSGSHDTRRTLSTGTLSGIRSHRTLVKVNFIQGLLDINHNPGQTAEVDSKATQDNGSGSIVSTLNYCRGIFHENLKSPNIKEFPNEENAAKKRVNQKICHKLSHYKYKLIVAIVGAFVLVSLAIGLGLGLGL